MKSVGKTKAEGQSKGTSPMTTDCRSSSSSSSSVGGPAPLLTLNKISPFPQPGKQTMKNNNKLPKQPRPFYSHFCCCCFPCRRTPSPSPLKEKLSPATTTSQFEQRLSVSKFTDTMATAPRISIGLHRFSLGEIKAMTRNFIPNNLVGQGGFGPVYKGYIDEKLRSGLEFQAVAVKVLDLHGSQGHSEWLAEVTILGQVKSPHLVKLVGYCCEEDQRVLVYEYMTRGNLDNHLFRKHSSVLPWSTRVKIAVGAAKGLAFLHRQSTPVIFRDFKASNILLDSNYTAKLSDFGLAKDGPTDEETHVSTRVMGTRGYAAPEYVATGHLTMRSDVYSFGVVLLELMSGRRSMDVDRHGREQSVVRWATPLLKEMRKVHQLMDPGLAGQYSDDGVNSITKLVCSCLSHNPKSRPTMEEVVKVLEMSLECEDAQTKPFVYVASPQVVSDYRR